ncbi:MAG: hypothetical protein NTU86_00765 [Burkholderiales bacterium]|nr:hypothetical protein [Burkholderiales bacterium]
MADTSHDFIRHYLGTVAAALLPVVFTAFLSIPYALSGHPGDARAADPVVESHTT